jgi:serine O-acetyltransferase
MAVLQITKHLVDGVNAFLNDVVEFPSAVKKNDPAARSALEVLLLYPGVKAVLLHRFSHMLWKSNAHWSARMVSEVGRFVTGVEIHPGAELGRRVVIDHGMGIVIGETAVVGDDVVLFQQVTLGSAHSAQGRRHPIVERGAVVGAGAVVLGAVVVGENAKVGAGAVVTKDVPPNSVVVGIPAQSVTRSQARIRAQS